jgi:hypothetical protein
MSDYLSHSKGEIASALKLLSACSTDFEAIVFARVSKSSYSKHICKLFFRQLIKDKKQKTFNEWK